MRIFSYGGGVQSTAALVLAAQGKIDFPTFLFCNVGDDSENPDTLKYVQNVAMPYAQAHDITLIELQRTWHKGERAGQPVTLYGLLTRPGSKSIGIPVRMSNGAPGRRSCTVDFKIEVVDRWLKEHVGSNREIVESLGFQPWFMSESEAQDKDIKAVVGLGISLDERLRVRYPLTDPETPWKRREYPLIDLRLDRAQCTNIIRAAGLPVPPKSSCWFCPFHSLRVWQEMRHKQPELFQKACNLETLINERRASLGKDQVWFTDRLKPLVQATTDYIQGDLFEGDEQTACESGYCMM